MAMYKISKMKKEEDPELIEVDYTFCKVNVLCFASIAAVWEKVQRI